MSTEKKIRAVSYWVLHPRYAVGKITRDIDALTRLANKYGSDKGDLWRGRHHYTRVYDSLFTPVKNKSIKLVEIGLLHRSHTEWRDPTARDQGGQAAAAAPSLKMWAEFFPYANIYGFDINDFTQVALDRITIVQGDAGETRDLSRLVDVVGGDIDIIIDDASHASHHQQIALAFLFEKLKEGGLYIIEDLKAQPPSLERGDAEKTVDVLKRGIITGSYCTAYIDEQTSDYLSSTIYDIQFFDSIGSDPLSGNDSIAVLRKKLGSD